MSLVLLGCGKRKREPGWRGPLVDLYTGNHYRARLAYARKLGGPDWILSAFWGIKSPGYTSAPYDRTLADRATRQWFTGCCLAVLRAETAPGDSVVVLAGKLYWEGWASTLRAEGRQVETPLAGMRMGEQIAWLRRAVGAPDA